MGVRRPAGARTIGGGLLALSLMSACAAGPGAEFIKAGDEALRAGRPEDALVAYDQAVEEGATESRLRSRREDAQEAMVTRRIQQAEALEREGDHLGALELLLEARALDPASEEITAALASHSRAWLERAKDLAASDDRAGAIRSLDRLVAVYPDAPGVAATRAGIISEWTEVLLERARAAERADQPATALLNWAILAAQNPDEPLFGEELVPLRDRLQSSLAVPTALFLGSANQSGGFGDPSAASLRDLLGSRLAAGDLRVPGVRWVERSFGEPGPAVTVTALGEISSADVQRGPGVYRVLESSRNVPNPELAAVQSRLMEVEGGLKELSRQIERYQASYRHSEGPSRTKMEEAIRRSQSEYDRLAAEAYDLRLRQQTLPPMVTQPVYREYPVEDEVHSRRMEVTLEIKVAGTSTSDGAPQWIVGHGEETDTLRLGDPSRGIPDDPLVFARTDAELRQLAVADALAAAKVALSGIPGEVAQQWLAHAEQSERSGDLPEATRAYVNHVLLTAERPAEAAVSFFARQGLPSPSLLRGELAAPAPAPAP